MKKILSLFAVGLFLLALVVSCKKDETTPTSALVGSWKFLSSAKTLCTDPLDNYSEVCSTADCGTLTITSTGTWSFAITGGATMSGTYTATGNSITISETGIPTKNNTYTIVGTTLTFVEADAGGGCTETTTFTKV